MRYGRGCEVLITATAGYRLASNGYDSRGDGSYTSFDGGQSWS